MSLKRDIARVFSSNVIALLVGIITGFLVPAFLPLDQYAYLKTFTLYIGYVGILHFGFIDGLYIKYGGKREEELDKSILKGEHRFLLFLQLAVTMVFLALGIAFKDGILIAFSLAIIPTNMRTLFQFLFQALGQFGLYSKIALLTPNLLLLTNLFLIYVLRINNFWPFVFGSLGVYYIVFIGLEIMFLRRVRGCKPLNDNKELINNFRVGIFVMTGNLSALLFYSMDRWFVKLLFSISSFAYYSFAISMMSIVNVLISSITMTFYPYLVRNQEEDLLKKIKTGLLVIGTVASGAYFVFAFIVRVFMKKYIPSLDIISILFAECPAVIVINALYVNLYKARKRERQYFFTVFRMLAVTLVLNAVSVLLYKRPQSIALATTLSFYVWYVFSSRHFDALKIRAKELIYLLSYLTLFFISAILLSWWQGLIAYPLSIVGLNLLFYYSEMKEWVRENLKGVGIMRRLRRPLRLSGGRVRVDLRIVGVTLFLALVVVVAMYLRTNHWVNARPGNPVVVKETQPNQPTVTEAPQRKHGTEARDLRSNTANTKIVTVGDSFTYGNPFGPQESWPKWVANLLGVDVVNNARIGQTSRDVLTHFDRDVLAYNPGRVVIFVGDGDAIKRVSEADYQNDIKAMVEKAWASNITPILALPVPYRGLSQPIGAMRSWLTAYAKEQKIRTLDFASVLFDSQGNYLPGMSNDGKYPSLQGYRAMGDYAVQVLEKG
ncbi:GDSL-like lipase/acylhydrolase [Peptococcaceae bacterium CEB3]|nr:GDSL-like lipase/acylhydrolase [Peptococcaceae bacterium CEB3]